MPTISNLSSLTSITGTLIFPVVDLTSTIPNKRATLQQLKSWIEGNATVASVAGRIGDIILTYEDIGGLSTVAHTGNYSDLEGRPATYTVATATSTVLGGVRIGKNINVTNTGTISLNTATDSTIGLVKIGTGISVTYDGTISTTPISSSTVATGLSVYSGVLYVNTATAGALGGVIVGNGLSVTPLGVLSVNTATTTTSGSVVVGDGLYLNNLVTVNLATATDTILGGIKAGPGVLITPDGTMTVTTGSFALQTATSILLGGVKIGNNISITGDGTISLNGGFTQTFITLNSAGSGSFLTQGTGSTYQSSGIVVNRGTGTVATFGYTDNYYISTGTSSTSRTRGIWVVGMADASTVYGATGLMVDSIRVSSTATELNIFGYNNSNTAVISVRGTTGYENRVTQDYHIPNKKYVDVRSTSTATASTVGVVKLGFGITGQGDGTINVGTASNVNYGLVKVGVGLAINDNTVSAAQTGVLSVTTATTGTIGGVRLGWPNSFGISIDNSSNTTTGIISLTTATTSTIGGIKIGSGSGLSINAGGFLNLGAATSSALGGVTAGSNMAVDVSGVLTFAGGTVANSVYLSNATAATSTSTGTLVVAGGVGINGDLHISGNITASKLTIEYTTITTTLVQTDDIISTLNTTQATSTSTGALKVAGGVGIGGNLYIGGKLNLVNSSTFTGSVLIDNTTNSESSTTGALVVSGGVGIKGDIYTGGKISLNTWYNSNSIETNGAIAVSGSPVLLALRSKHGMMGYDTVFNNGLDFVSIGDVSTLGTIALRQLTGNNQNWALPIFINTLSQILLGNLTAPSPTTKSTATVVVEGSMYISTTTSAVSTNTGALQIVGGVGVGKQLFVGGNSTFVGITTVTNTTNATSTNTGALQVAGGVGIGGQVFIGGNTNIVGITTVTNTTNATSTNTGALQVVGGVGIGGNLKVGGTGTQIGSFFSNFGEVTVNMGNQPIYTTSTTVSDSRAVVGARILVMPSATIGASNAGGDELEMDNFAVSASVTTNGIINLYITALPGPVIGQRTFNYILG